MNAKMSVFVICIEVIIYLLLCDLHDCTFKGKVFTDSPLLTYGLFHRYFQKCSEQLHDGKLGTAASDIMYVKLFICVAG